MLSKLIYLFLTCHFVLMPILDATPGKIQALYNTLDRYSVSQHLAFYELYPDSAEGQKSLQTAWKLLTGNENIKKLDFESFTILPEGVNAIVSLINKQANEATADLSIETLDIVQRIAERLPNRKLKGYNCKNEAEVLQLSPGEIDLARGLFLSQLGDDLPATDVSRLKSCRNYEALIDLMALQVLARLPAGASPEKKICTINTFIFEEMGFRFPPHSEYADDIDLYTFLPSVLDSRRGVCLGVSILYMCLAQRLDLNLEMITPPGHIYVRYKDGSKEINIETTARGINVDSEEYLGIETRSLPQRNLKEVIGMAHFNQASTFWAKNEYALALASYQKAQKYMQGDMLLKELMAYQYLFNGNVAEGKRILQEVKDFIPDHGISRDSTAEDYLNGAVDEEGIKIIFMHVDDKRESILKKQKALQEILTKFPNFRAGHFNLAVTWLQLHREGEALKALERYQTLDPSDPTAEYYLTVLYATRLDYNRAWDHLLKLEDLLHQRNHYPKLLKNLRKGLSTIAPF